jgi:hypothetical protein
MLELPPAARADEDTRLRKLPHRRSEDEAWRARLRDLPSPAWSERHREAAVVRELSPRSHGQQAGPATEGPTRREGSRRLRELSRLARGTPKGRSGDLHRMSQGADPARAERNPLRDLSPILNV